MAELDAVLEAPELEVIDPAAETQAEPTVEPVVKAEADGSEAGGKRDARVMPQWLRDLKATNNPGYKDANEKFWALRDLDGKLKDRDLDKLFPWLDEQGGMDTIQSTLQEREAKAQELDAITDSISRGDVAVLDRVPDEAVASLAPAMMEKWRNTSPETYEKAVYGALSQVMEGAKVPALYGQGEQTLQMMMLQAQTALSMTTDPAQKGEIAAGVMARLEQVLGSFQSKASAPVQAQQKPAAQPNGKPVETVESVKAGVFNKQFAEDYQSAQNEMAAAELKQYLEDDPASVLNELAIRNLHDRTEKQLNADKKLQGDLDNLFKAAQKNGDLKPFFKLYRSRYAAAAKGIAAEVGPKIFRGAAKSKAGSPAPSPRPARPAALPQVSRDPAVDILRRAMER